MKRVVSDHRALFLIVGMLLAVAGVAWGAGSPAQARPARTAPKGKPSVTQVAATRAPAHAKLASRAKVTTPKQVTVAPSQVAGAQGMRIFRDPQSGEIGPPDVKVLTPTRSDSRATHSSLKAVTLPDGSKMVDLQGQFQESMVMKIDSKGHRTVECVTDVKPSDVLAPAKPAARTSSSVPATKREDK
jgi:hypothetical protein